MYYDDEVMEESAQSKVFEKFEAKPDGDDGGDDDDGQQREAGQVKRKTTQPESLHGFKLYDYVRICIEILTGGRETGQAPTLGLRLGCKLIRRLQK